MKEYNNNTPQNSIYPEKAYNTINVNSPKLIEDSMSVNYGSCNKCLLTIIGFVALVFGGIASVIEVNEFSALVIVVLTFLVILLMIFSKRNILFIKNEEYNSLTAKVYNYMGCRCKKKTFNYLTNIQFDIRSIPPKDNNSKTRYRLFVFNNLSDLKSKYTENDNIKTHPLQLYYCFDKLELDISYSLLKLNLNNFTSSPTDFDSPIFFDLNRYKDKTKNPNNSDTKYSNPYQITYSRLMRFSNYFYTYHIRDPNERLKDNKCSSFFFLIYFNIFVGGIMTAIALYEIKVKSVIFLLLLAIGSPLFLDLIIFLIYICLQNRVLRIDCIFSPDFDRIFIGLTTINEKHYKNTFEFRIEEISKFSVNINNPNILTVTVSDINIDICEVCDNERLNDFIYLLNEKINDIKNVPDVLNQNKEENIQ